MKTETKILELAKSNNWDLHLNQPSKHMIRLVKNPYMIDVWPRRMTVGTYLNHPRKGKTQLFRRNVSLELLSNIFKNPRQHTGTGYRKKK